MPQREENGLDKFFRIVFGGLAPFARAVFHHTTTFIFVAFCLFCARQVVPIFFSKTDEVAGWLHLIDTYGTLLLLAGFAVFITLEIVMVVYDRIWGKTTSSETIGDSGHG